MENIELPRPDYAAVNRQRVFRYKKFFKDPECTILNTEMVASAKNYYKTRPVEFIEHWGITYDPRNAGTEFPTTMPFVLFPRQAELIEFIIECVKDKESGAIEKCRDAGVTWIVVNVSVWMWLFMEGSSVGWGSRKESLVDKIGDADSIFEKIRMVINGLPSFFKPDEYDERKHSAYMRILNPYNNSSITGEAGDSIGRGGRKSQSMDSKIMTPSGWSTMGEMEVGKVITGADGKTTVVTGIYPQGKVDIYKVTTSDGRSTECCEDHLWRVTTPNDRKKTFDTGEEFNRVLQLKDMVGNLKRGASGYKYQIPIVKPVHFRKKKLPMDPYLLGSLLGDGYLPKSGTITFSTGDQESVEELNCALNRSRSDNKLQLKHKKEYEYGISNKEHQGKKNWLGIALDELDLRGKKSDTKFIPEMFKLSFIEDRLEMLRGLMDTDGSCSLSKGVPVISYASASKQLSDDVRFIVWSLGGVARYHVISDNRKESYFDMHTLTIKLPSGMIPFKLQRKIDVMGPRRNTLNPAIKSIELIGKKEAQCISVSADDKLYVTDDFMVTHNTMYAVDEASHLERQEKVESALMENTMTQMAISSVYGPTTVFQRKVDNGEVWHKGRKMTPGMTRVFIFDWRDHPFKTQEWYNIKRAKAEREGLLHIFAQEVDRDASAAVEGVLIDVRWIKAAIDAHLNIGITPTGKTYAGFDLSDEGRDKHALAIRKGILLKKIDDWAAGDGGNATRKTLMHCQKEKVDSLQYDSIGVGATAKSEINRQREDGKLPKNLEVVGWCASASPFKAKSRLIRGDKNSPKIGDFFANLKAQGYWELRSRFEKTYKVIEEGASYPEDELISLCSKIPCLHEIIKELSQPTYQPNSAGKIVIDKNPDGSKSPNKADAIMIAFWPKTTTKMLI